MLNKAKALKNYKLNCIDGEIGKVKDFYFEDQTWFIKYLIVNTGNWLIGRQVLISPSSIISVNTEEEYIKTNLTKQQIEDSPSLESDKPVSLQFQEDYYGYYGLPVHAAGLGYAGGYGLGFSEGENVMPIQTRQDSEEKMNSDMAEKNNWDPHLRSTHNVTGYEIQAVDGKIGHVDDFIIEDEVWRIQYIEIDTKNWIPGRKILISTNWIKSISWDDFTVFVNLYCGEIKQAPEYTEETILNRDYEIKLYRHYNRKIDWVDISGMKDDSVN